MPKPTDCSTEKSVSHDNFCPWFKSQNGTDEFFGSQSRCRHSKLPLPPLRLELLPKPVSVSRLTRMTVFEETPPRKVSGIHLVSLKTSPVSD